MELYRGYKFRIYPTKDQQETINQIIHSCNFVYNYFINQIQQHYQETGKTLPVNKCIKELPALKKEYPDLKNGESTSMQQTLIHLNRAFKNYFEGRALFPHYKSNTLDRSYTCTKNGRTPSNIRIEDDMLILPKLGKVKVNFHHPLPENITITSVTVRQNYSDRYEVSIQTIEEIKVEVAEERKILGIVYSPEYFFVASNGSRGEIPESYQKVLKRIKRIKNNINRKKDGSRNKQKEKYKLKKAFEKADNIKKDYLHKWSKTLTDKYNTIVVKEFDPELFDTKTSRREGWNQFISYLRYKLEQKGGELIIISNEKLPTEEITDFSYKNALAHAQYLTKLINY